LFYLFDQTGRFAANAGLSPYTLVPSTLNLWTQNLSNLYNVSCYFGFYLTLRANTN